MPSRPWLRVLWVALIPVVVFPLYGQTSCDPCPTASNPCLRAAGRSTETNQCVYVNQLDGVACDAQGAAGSCFDGQCLPAECAGVSAFGECDLGGGATGICVDFQCIATAPDDPCLQVGVGRINCCSDPGCSIASGAYCNDPLDDGTTCDPSGVEPADQGGQDGICVAGTCVATTGACADVSCPTIWEEPCARDYCNVQTGECQEWWVDTYTECLDADTNSPGYCSLGACLPSNGDGCQCGGAGPCTVAACTYPCAFTVPGCTIEDYLTQTPSCYRWNRPVGAPCVGAPGTCSFNGVCAFGGCQDDSQCSDGNPCTDNTCNPFGLLCDTEPLPDGTSCGESHDGQVLARCANGQCLPDLCINRDCDDGDSCTEDVCTPPYGICSNPAVPSGGDCIGESGQCFNGVCQPVITPECQHQPFDPDRNFPECDDGNVCTFNRCNFANQCVNPPIEYQASCGPGGSGVCVGGNCFILP